MRFLLKENPWFFDLPVFVFYTDNKDREVINTYNELFFGPAAKFPTILFILILAWSIAWKGLALWRAARASQKYWFIAMLIVSSLGLLEIVYLAFFQKKTKK